MNMHSDITDETSVNMTSKGQVLIPKDIRDRLGLVPGKAVRVGMNDLGQAVILPAAPAAQESGGERRVRIEAAILAARGRYFADGRSTDEIMFDLRGDRTP